jgi:hypothetical protein
MRRRRNIIWFFLAILGAGAAFLLWTEFGELWLDNYGMQMGLLAGAFAGAIALPLARDPEIGGKFVLGAVFGMLVVAFIQAMAFANLIQSTPGLLSANDAAATGQFGRETITRLIYGVGGGSILFMFFVAPHLVILGSMLGVLVGVLLGGLFHPFLIGQGIVLSREIFLFLLGLITMSVLYIVANRRDE